MIDSLLNILAPHVCVACGSEGCLLCAACGKKCISHDSTCFFCGLAVINNELCWACQSRYRLATLTSVGWYNQELKAAVQAYKFGAKKGGAKSLALLLGQVGGNTDDHVITYIPTSARHIRQRGFDHTKVLARAYAARVALPCTTTLARTNNSRQLGSSKTARHSSVKGAFVAKCPHTFAGKDVILIDDVITTGSTLSEAAKVLLQAGAKSVHALVLAKTPAHTGPNR
ncbi:ComF family protein [bacterium]|nr:ComF family protein [bacterium]NDD84537.1 ComF family protein [bacterium]NDG30959.1 ComF family protein [bacterium]